MNILKKIMQTGALAGACGLLGAGCASNQMGEPGRPIIESAGAQTTLEAPPNSLDTSVGAPGGYISGQKVWDGNHWVNLQPQPEQR